MQRWVQSLHFQYFVRPQLTDVTAGKHVFTSHYKTPPPFPHSPSFSSHKLLHILLHSLSRSDADSSPAPCTFSLISRPWFSLCLPSHSGSFSCVTASCCLLSKSSRRVVSRPHVETNLNILLLRQISFFCCFPPLRGLRWLLSRSCSDTRCAKVSLCCMCRMMQTLGGVSSIVASRYTNTRDYNAAAATAVRLNQKKQGEGTLVKNILKNVRCSEDTEESLWEAVGGLKNKCKEFGRVCQLRSKTPTSRQDTVVCEDVFCTEQSGRVNRLFSVCQLISQVTDLLLRSGT